jgi:hypothetical protein
MKAAKQFFFEKKATRPGNQKTHADLACAGGMDRSE